MGIYTQTVQQLYVAYFNRPADFGGLQYWETAVAAENGSIASISASFAKSAEYIAAYAGKTNAQIVSQVYMNLFGRPAEQGGLDYWAPLLDQHKITIDNVVTQVAHGAQGSDATAYNVKVNAASIFTSSLNTPERVQAYAGDAALILAKDFIKSVFDTASFNAAVLSVKFIATINSFITLYNQDSVILTLTSGVDHIAPSSDVLLSGNDTINATAETFNSADQLDGGAKTDQLVVIAATGKAYVAPASASVNNIEILKFTGDNTVSVDSTNWKAVNKLTVSAVGGENIITAANTTVSAKDTLGSGTAAIHGAGSVTLIAGQTTTGSISVGASGMVLVRSTIAGNFQAGDIVINGGTSIAVTQLFGAGVTTAKNAAVTVNGTAQTADVTVINAYVVGDHAPQTHDNSVLINGANSGANNGAAAGVKTVKVSEYSSLTINSDALTKLDLLSSVGDVHLIGHQSALAISLTGVEGGTLTLPNSVQTLTIDSTSSTKLTNIIGSGLSTLHLTGFGNVALGLSNLDALKILIIGDILTLVNGLDKLHLELLDASTRVNPGTYQLDGAQTAFVGSRHGDSLILTGTTVSKNIALGTGDDHLTLLNSTVVTANAHLDGGAGTDILTLNADTAIKLSADPAFAAAVTGFEELEINGFIGRPGSQTVDISLLPNVKALAVSGGDVQAISSLTLNNWASDRTLIVDGAGVIVTLQNPAFAAGKSDVLNVSLQSSTSAQPHNYSSGFIVPGIEVLDITTGEKASAPFGSIANLAFQGDDVKTIFVHGSLASLNLMSDSAEITLVDASKLGGGLTFTAGVLTGKATIIGGQAILSGVSFSEANIIDLHAATHGAIYIGSDNIDVVTVGTGSNSITVGFSSSPGFNTFDKVTFASTGASLDAFTTITDPHSRLELQFVPHGSQKLITQQITSPAGADLQTFVNAAIHQAGNASANGVFSWFQLHGDTYLVESNHDGSAANAVFVNGTDQLVKLSGVVDLSQAVISGASISLV